jgi:hypothetical protein
MNRQNSSPLPTSKAQLNPCVVSGGQEGVLLLSRVGTAQTALHACIHHESALGGARAISLLTEHYFIRLPHIRITVFFILDASTWMDHWELRTGMMLHLIDRAAAQALNEFFLLLTPDWHHSWWNGWG